MADLGNGLRVRVMAIAGAEVVAPAGEIDLATADQLVDTIRALGPDTPIVLDLAEVTFIDSSGIRALLDIQQIAKDRGVVLAVARPARTVVRLLDLTELRDRFHEIDGIDPESIAGLGGATPPA